MGIRILSKLQLPSFNGFEAMINMNEYEYIKKNYKCVLRTPLGDSIWKHQEKHEDLSIFFFDQKHSKLLIF